MAGGTAACAACKYQRRRCTPDCPLAEFFPQDRSRVFRNAHRLFGVSNILKTLARAGKERRREAMHCIIYEAQAWDINPATGCVPIIQDLQRRIRQAELDLRRAYAGIQACRAAAAQGRPPVFPVSDAGDPSASSSSSAAPPPPFQFQLATGNNDATAEAYDGGGGLPFMMYGGEQQQMMMNAAASDGENIALQMPTWTMMMQPPQHVYDMASPATAVADMAAGKVVPQQQDHRFFLDAAMVPQPQHQQQHIPIQLAAELDDEMSYLVDGMDGDHEMHHESTSMDSMDSSDKKAALKAPKMEDDNGFK